MQKVVPTIASYMIVNAQANEFSMKWGNYHNSTMCSSEHERRGDNQPCCGQVGKSLCKNFGVIRWSDEKCQGILPDAENEVQYEGKLYTCEDLKKNQAVHFKTKCKTDLYGEDVFKYCGGKRDQISCVDGYTAFVENRQTILVSENDGEQVWTYTCVPDGTEPALFNYDDCCYSQRVECLDLDFECRNEYSMFIYNQTHVNGIELDELQNAFKHNSDVTNNVSDWYEKKCVQVLENECKDHIEKSCWKQPKELLSKCYVLQDGPLKCQDAPKECIQAFEWNCQENSAQAKCVKLEQCGDYIGCEDYFKECKPIEDDLRECNDIKDTCLTFYDCYKNKEIKVLAKSKDDFERLRPFCKNKWQTFGRCMKIVDTCLFESITGFCSQFEIELEQDYFFSKSSRTGAIRGFGDGLLASAVMVSLLVGF